ncbi:DEAD/DEAH box helicase [Castellaniella defragrans]|nr:DEAD/DEAH box helicase [Castellaniella defragrans]
MMKLVGNISRLPGANLQQAICLGVRPEVGVLCFESPRNSSPKNQGAKK